MALTLLVLVVLAYVVHRVTTEEERATIAGRVYSLVQRAISTAVERSQAHAPFFEGLRARTRFAPVTPLIVIAYVVMFVIVLATSLFQGHDTVVAWGASVGPRTTNGEWWRLVTSLFIHTGPLQLLASVAGLFLLGRVLERLVGSVALAVVYVTSGVFAGLTTLAMSPLAVSAGASGAICGVYGLALATAIWGFVQRPRLEVPSEIVKWLAWAGFVFLVYNLPTDAVPLQAEFTGFVVGLLVGVAIGEDVGTQRTPVKRSAGIAALAATLALVATVPLSGITDVLPDIGRMLATDERTAATFRTAATQLTLGRKSEKEMIELIEREIIPALEKEQLRLKPRGVVPDDQQALNATARQYVGLRIESWRLRATAFRQGSVAMLRQADNKEGAARDLLVRHPLSPG